MPAKKQSRSLKTKNLTGNKKRLGLIIFAFAVVGAVFLIRSFASTVVISFNAGDNIASNNIGGFNQYNAQAVTETVTDGKKTNTYTFAELSRGDNDGVPSYLDYKATLNEGYYQGCFTAKPTTKGASAVISTLYPNGTIGQNTLFVKESVPTGWSSTPATLNTFNDYCVNFVVTSANNGKQFSFRFNVQSDSQKLATNKWRVGNVTLKLNSRAETTPGMVVEAARQLINEKNATPSQPASGAVFYEDINDRQGSTQMSVSSDPNAKVAIVNDTINGAATQVAQLSGSGGDVSLFTNFINSANNANYSTSQPDPVKSSTKTYRACFVVKSTTPSAITGNSTATLYESANNSVTGQYSIAGQQNITGTGSYQTACINHSGIKAGEYLQFRFTTNANDGTWLIQDAYIQEV